MVNSLSEFDEILSDIRRKVKRLGITREDISEEIRALRAESRKRTHPNQTD